MIGDFTRFNGTSQLKTPTAHGNLKERDRFSQVFSVQVNYWEHKPAQYEALFNELARRDIRTVSTFIPWAHIETDIHHHLKKFVRAAAAAKFFVRIFVMPELGVNFPNAGIPKDLLSSVSNLAVDKMGRVIYNHAAPNVFPLPSFSSPEVLKRFGNYLIKVGSILGETFEEAGTSKFCEVLVTNSFFNYYRSHGLSVSDHGDYSAAQVMAFRDFLDREYKTTKPSADQDLFKIQLYENYNRHRFFSHVEKLLREKTEMVFSRRTSRCELRHIDLFNPECDPNSAYQQLLTEVFSLRPSLERYFQNIVAGGHRGEAIYLGNSGTFRRFSDQEKSFLMLAALIYSGEVSIQSEELLKLSTNFQRKLFGLVQFFDDKKFTRRVEVSYISASKFSMEQRSFKILSAMSSGVLGAHAGLEGFARKLSQKLVFFDPMTVARLYEFTHAMTLAQAGKVVAIPAPMNFFADKSRSDALNFENYTEEAKEQFEKFRKGRHSLKINLGLRYEVFDMGLGQVVFYDPRSFWLNPDSVSSAKVELPRFFQALLGLAEVKPVCAVNNPQLQVASYHSEEDAAQRLVFLINPTAQEIQAKLSFAENVKLQGLPVAGLKGTEPITGTVFELAVPPFGVLSMQLEQVGTSELPAVENDTFDSGEVTERPWI